MRRWSYAVLLAATGGALAAPAAPAVTWADWVGDWDGKLKWASCAIEGPPSATFAIDATDGTMAIDLTGAGSAFGKLTLVEDGPGWTGQQSDVTVHVTRGKTAGIDVAVDLQSGCTVHGSTQRASTGIAACDRLDAWARIEARCTRLGRPPLENPARLVRQRETWSKAQGDARTKLAAQCDARATKVSAELIDAGCTPNPDPVGHRAPACQALRQSAAKLTRCSSIASSISSALDAQAAQLASAAQTADDASLPVVEQQCTHLREDIVSLGQKYGCLP